MTIHHGDCAEVMAAMPPDSIDAIVCDPPYGIRFMGKTWDGTDIEAHAAVRAAEKSKAPGGTANVNGSTPRYSPAESAGTYDRSPAANRAFQHWTEDWAIAALRVAKPGAYLLAFGGTRTVHRMTVALEDAGWIIRDMLVWAYASGFPKSKALLKPAWEPIVMARKPGPLRDLDIDGCRIAHNEAIRTPPDQPGYNKFFGQGGRHGETLELKPEGRWPANVVLTDPVFDGGWEGVVGGGEASYNPAGVHGKDHVGPRGGASWELSPKDVFGYGDTGTYSRFFLVPKASRSDREPVMPGMLEEQEVYIHNSEGRDMTRPGNAIPDGARDRIEQGLPGRISRRNVHPTVKPIELMRHLVRLVTPAGGTVLDPFGGSGTTALAAEQEGRDWVLIEREAEYVRIAEARLSGWQRGLGLDWEVA